MNFPILDPETKLAAPEPECPTPRPEKPQPVRRRTMQRRNTERASVSAALTTSSHHTSAERRVGARARVAHLLLHCTRTQLTRLAQSCDYGPRLRQLGHTTTTALCASPTTVIAP